MAIYRSGKHSTLYLVLGCLALSCGRPGYLKPAANGRELVLQSLGTGRIHDISVAADEKTLALAQDDGIRLINWDLHVIGYWSSNGDKILQVVHDNEGKYIAARGSEGRIYIFEPDLKQRTQFDAGAEQGLSVSRYGDYLIASVAKNAIAVFSPDGTKLSEVRSGAQPITQIVSLGGGEMFLLIGTNEIMIAHNSGSVRRRFTIPGDRIVALVRDGASSVHALRADQSIVEIGFNGKLQERAPMRSGRVRRVQTCPVSNGFLYTTSDRRWAYQTTPFTHFSYYSLCPIAEKKSELVMIGLARNCRAAFVTTEEGHGCLDGRYSDKATQLENTFYGDAIVHLHSDMARMVSAQSSGSIRLHTLGQRESRSFSHFGFKAAIMALSTKDNTLAIADSGGKMHILGGAAGMLTTVNEHKGEVRSLKALSDGTFAGADRSHGPVVLVSAQGALLRSIPVGFSRDIRSMAFDTQRGDVVLCGENVQCEAFDRAGERIFSARLSFDHRRGSRSAIGVAFFPDGRLLHGNADGRMAILNGRYETLKEIEGRDVNLGEFIVAPDGSFFITRDGSAISVFDAQGKTLFPRQYFKSGITAVAIAPDAKRFALATQDGKISEYDPHGRILLEQIVPGQRTETLGYAAQGRLWVRMFDDGVIDFVDRESGGRVATLHLLNGSAGNSTTVFAIVHTPSGYYDYSHPDALALIRRSGSAVQPPDEDKHVKGLLNDILQRY